jgi:hypothetical protein
LSRNFHVAVHGADGPHLGSSRWCKVLPPVLLTPPNRVGRPPKQGDFAFFIDGKEEGGDFRAYADIDPTPWRPRSDTDQTCSTPVMF